jgi:hypothetical protein
MDTNQQEAQQNLHKTYISEENQNRISDTLRAEEAENSTEGERADIPAEPMASDEMSTAGAIPPQGDSHEPEGLSAEATEWTPVTATMDAERVAGRPVGEVYGQEGDLRAMAANSEEAENGDTPPEEAVSSPS